jgi:uncharacterized protein YjbJ (UPF0337 family)
MSWEDVGSDWEQRKAAAKEQWAELTDGDLRNIHGSRDLLADALHRRYGIAYEQAERRIDWWLQTLDRESALLPRRFLHVQ